MRNFSYEFDEELSLWVVDDILSDAKSIYSDTDGRSSWGGWSDKYGSPLKYFFEADGMIMGVRVENEEDQVSEIEVEDLSDTKTFGNYEEASERYMMDVIDTIDQADKDPKDF